MHIKSSWILYPCHAYSNTIKLLTLRNAATEATNSLVESTSLDRSSAPTLFPSSLREKRSVGTVMWLQRTLAILCRCTDRIRYAWHRMHSCGIAGTAVFWNFEMQCALIWMHRFNGLSTNQPGSSCLPQGLVLCSILSSPEGGLTLLGLYLSGIALQHVQLQSASESALTLLFAGRELLVLGSK